ncbi:vanadium-dependent haloperoxidase, partial [Hydrocoleum sp. CS-953]|uniref:vanadium-dependent haloperoxidase n=1 Tax=Hydrocoleum sp. CS-953 TaxID=1671698 RepID=UPI00117AFB7D
MNELQVDPNTQLVTVNDPSPSISVLWDRAVQQAVINSRVGPTVASRAYSMVHTAIYDAWAAYDPLAVGTQLGDDLQRPESENTEANKAEAMSFSAYRVLTDLFPEEVEIFNDVMETLGLDPNNTTTDTTTPAGIGNVSGQALLAFRHNDGSNQEGNDPNGDGTPYSDISGYQPQNPAGDPIDIEFWTPENVPIDDPNGRVQNFLTPQWGNVTPFGLKSGEELRPVAPEPFLLVDGEVDLDAGTITLADQSVVPISQDIIGTIINPEFIAQTEQVVNFSANLTDEQKLIAEFWEDGGGTSFPPGTWMSFGQFVSARDEHTLDQDVELFFNLGNAVFDAGVATWEAKVFYDYARPVRTVRELGEQGLIGEFNEELGGYAIEAWAGPGEGTQTILATDFLTYQTPGSDPSPPFAEYVSGHSTFSAAGAEILQRFTGDDEFGASVTFAPGESRFEPGVTPTETVTLEWETFSEASDEAGFSRLYGGIHFEDGDVNGRSLGRQVAGEVWEEAQSLLTPNKIMGTNGDDE